MNLIALLLLMALGLFGCKDKQVRGPIQHFQDKDANGIVWREYEGYLDRTLQPIPHGKVTFYYPGTNQKRFEGTAEDGLFVGIWYEYSQEGNLIGEVEHKKGLPEGLLKVYYPNGKLKVSGQMIRGLQHGQWIFYDEEGKIIKREYWEKGNKILEEQAQ